MANIFRQAIAKRVFSAIGNRCNFDQNTFIAKCAPLIRVNKKFEDPPEMELSWHDVFTNFQLSDTKITTEIVTAIEGNGLLLPDGIVNVSRSDTDKWKMLFSINKDLFVKSVLFEMFNHVKNIRNSSFLLKTIQKENIIVEYSSPNIAKPFHVGHIRSTIIGNSIANMQKYIGHNVTRINYLGDWGTQYGILVAGFNSMSSEEELKENPIEHLFNVYVAANAKAENDTEFMQKSKDILTKMENDENDDLVNQWKRIKDISLTEFNTMYTRLGIQFDEIQSESKYYKKAIEIAQDLQRKGLAYISDEGALVMNVLCANNVECEIPILKKDQSTLYITRDIAAAIDRKNVLKFDKMYYVVDNRQLGHFSDLKFILNKMGYDWAKNLNHINFGQINGLSSRKGDVVYLDELLDKAKDLALKSMENSTNTNIEADPEKTAQTLGLSSIIINDLKSKRQKNCKFEWKKVLHVKGNSGITMQYTHARLAALERKFGPLLNPNCDTDLLYEPEALNLVTHLANFDETLFEMHKELQPSVLVQYLFKLCFYIGKANATLKIEKTERRIAEPRYFLLHTARLVLKEGFKMLGIDPLDRM